MTKAGFDLKPLLQKLDIATKRGVTSSMIGSYRSVFRGHGIEFDSYRPYSPDDDAGAIDWKASRRSNQVLIKQFIEERNLNVVLMVDVSESMLHGSSRGKLKIEYAAETAASLVYAVLKADDSAGWILFSDDVKVIKNPDKGLARFYQFSQDMVDPKHYGGHTQLKKILEHVPERVQQQSVIILVSDFINVGPGWEESLKQLTHKYDIIAIVVHDLFDHTLPDENAFVVFEHPTSGEQMVVNSQVAKRAFEQRARAFDASLRDKFIKAQVEFVHLTTSESFVQPLMLFFEQRRNRWR